MIYWACLSSTHQNSLGLDIQEKHERKTEMELHKNETKSTNTIQLPTLASNCGLKKLTPMS